MVHCTGLGTPDGSWGRPCASTWRIGPIWRSFMPATSTCEILLPKQQRCDLLKFCLKDTPPRGQEIRNLLAIRPVVASTP